MTELEEKIQKELNKIIQISIIEDGSYYKFDNKYYILNDVLKESPDFFQTISVYDPSEIFIEYFIDKLDLKTIIEFTNLSSNFIDKHIQKFLNSVKICDIFAYQELDEIFILKYIHLLELDDYQDLCSYQNVPEEVIIKYKDYMWWRCFDNNPNFNFQSCSPKFKLLFGKYFV